MYIKDKLGNNVKLIPKRYSEIPDVDAYIDDFESLRLCREERELLDRILLGIRLEQFTNKMKENYLYRDQIKEAYPEKAVKVTTKHNHYSVVVYSNGLELKCEASLLSGLPVESKKRLY